jgi:hypothetical protein
MSKVVIAGDASGTGTFTISAPNGNTDRTLVLPDEAGTVLTSASNLAGVTGVGKVLQVVHFDTAASATGTTSLPDDDTIPQITEGTEFMSLAITPLRTNSTLIIDIVASMALSSANPLIAALFVDSTANAIGAMTQYIWGGGAPEAISFSVKVTSGSLTARTYRLRLGTPGGVTTTFNGLGGTRRMGGVMSSSIRITEIAA